jgi:hypothetical protein
MGEVYLMVKEWDERERELERTFSKRLVLAE